MPRPTRIVVLLAVAATSATLLAACGGEPRRGAVTDVTTPSVSVPQGTARVTDPARARYVRAVDAVCDRYNPEREQATAEAGSAPDADHAARAYDGTIAFAEAQLRAVEAVTPPAGDRILIARNVLDRLRERLTLRRELRADLAASDAASAQVNRAKLDTITLALESFARGYGFRVCGAG